mgnify:CR=1 FL=1
MTPTQLWQHALDRIPVLLIKDKALQERYLRDTLNLYSQEAGVLRTLKTSASSFAIPPHFLDINSCYDHDGSWCHAVIQNDQILIEFGTVPFDFHYFINLYAWELNSELPLNIETGLLIDYLESLLGEANALKLALTKAVQLDLEGKTPAEYAQQKERIVEQMKQKSIPFDVLIL